jgi:hypothetical protein
VAAQPPFFFFFNFVDFFINNKSAPTPEKISTVPVFSQNIPIRRYKKFSEKWVVSQLPLSSVVVVRPPFFFFFQKMSFMSNNSVPTPEKLSTFFLKNIPIRRGGKFSKKYVVFFFFFLFC